MQQKEETNLLFVAVIGFAFFILMRNSSTRYVIGPNGQPIMPQYLSGMSTAQQWQYQFQMQQQQNQVEQTRVQQVAGVLNNIMEKIWPSPQQPAQTMPMPQDDATVGQVAPGLDGITYNGTYYPQP